MKISENTCNSLLYKELYKYSLYSNELAKSLYGFKSVLSLNHLLFVKYIIGIILLGLKSPSQEIAASFAPTRGVRSPYPVAATLPRSTLPRRFKLSRVFFSKSCTTDLVRPSLSHFSGDHIRRTCVVRYCPKPLPSPSIRLILGIMEPFMRHLTLPTPLPSSLHSLSIRSQAPPVLRERRIAQRTAPKRGCSSIGYWKTQGLAPLRLR